MQNVNVFIKIPRDRLEVLIKRNLGGDFFWVFLCFIFSKKLLLDFFSKKAIYFFFPGKKMPVPVFLLICHVFLANLLSKTTLRATP